MTMHAGIRKLSALPWMTLGLALLLFGSLVGCLAPGVEVGVSGGYGGAYYEPVVVDYGGWGGGYRVGPGRGGERGPDRAGHAYRAAAPERRTPSIPHSHR